MQCKRFREVVPFFLSDVITGRVCENFWEHGRACENNCDRFLILHLIMRHAPYFLNTERLVAHHIFAQAMAKDPKSEQEVHMAVTGLQELVIDALINAWREEPLRVGTLVASLHQIMRGFHSRGLV